MAISVGGAPYYTVKIDGDEIDPLEYGITSIRSSNSDDEAASCTIIMRGEDISSAAQWAEGAKLELKYGWNGSAFGTWSGTLETNEPEFGDTESVTMNFYGSSFGLRDSNAPDSLKGTRRDIAKKLIEGAGLQADVRDVPNVTSKINAPEGSSTWEVLERIARDDGLILRESGATKITLADKETQDVLIEFWYRDAPAKLTPSLLSFTPRWTRKKRLRKVTVIGVSRSNHDRIVGEWEYKPSETIIKYKDKLGRNRTRTAKADDDRNNEVTLYLPVRSETEAKARAKAIGLRNETRTRTATARVPLVPCMNGEIVRLRGLLGRYAGLYYVTRVERDHMTGICELGLEWQQYKESDAT